MDGYEELEECKHIAELGTIGVSNRRTSLSWAGGLWQGHLLSFSLFFGAALTTTKKKPNFNTHVFLTK